MKFVVLYSYYFLLFSLSKAQNATIELEETSTEPTFETNPGYEKLEEKITKILNAFQVHSELIMKNASLQIRITEETSKRLREDTQRDILEEEKILIEETHFTDVEFLVKHCSSEQTEATDIMLQNALGGIRTCVGLATKKADLQQVLFEDLHDKLSSTGDELKKIQKKCINDDIEERQNCFFENLYLSNGPVVNLYLRKNEAEKGLTNSEEALKEMKNSIIECSDIVQKNLEKDKGIIIDNFKACCATVVSGTKMLLKLLPSKK